MALPPNLPDHIRAYLTSPEVDLQTVSAKQIRKKLATIFPDLDIKNLRSEIDEISIPIFHQIKESVEEAAAAAKAAQHPTSIDPAGGMTAAPYNYPSQSSSLPPLALPRPISNPDSSQVLKPAIKKSSQESSITTTTQRNGNKTKKRKSAAYVDTDDEDRPSGHKAAKNGQSKKPKAPRKPRPEGEGPGSNKGIHVELNCSTALAELIGVPMCSRPQVVKKIWDYIKANELQNPEDKRQIICDDAMKKVFNQNSVHMFTMNVRVLSLLSSPPPISSRSS